MAHLQLMFNIMENANRLDHMTRAEERSFLRARFSAHNLGETEFVGIYRLNFNVFNRLEDELEPLLRPRRLRPNNIPVSAKILTALSFYASGGYQPILGINLYASMSQPSVSNCIRQVTEALNNVEILNRHIKFPQTRAEREQVKLGYFRKYRIPGVVGCIDGSHIAIIRPSRFEERYFNRKLYHSRNIQVVCDSDYRILDVDASYGGASHDSFIWNNHHLKQRLLELNQAGEQSWLLGDSGYAQRPYMMIPIEGAAEGTREHYYTTQHKSARSTIERTFGVLKSRWRCLLRARELHYDSVMAGKIINACCVLHNMCKDEGMPDPPHLNPEDLEEENRRDVPQDPPQEPINNDLRFGRRVRQRLINQMWFAR